jgi:predicted dehydrogenase
VVWLLGLPVSVEAHLKTVNRAVNGENDVLAIFHYPDFDFVFTASLHDLKGINFLDVSGDQGRLNIEKTAMTAYFHEDELLANKEAKLYVGSVVLTRFNNQKSPNSSKNRSKSRGSKPTIITRSRTILSTPRRSSPIRD